GATRKGHQEKKKAVQGTLDVTIYYTTDGNKPQPFKRLGYENHNTWIYKEPITLPGGKITIKALAVTKDGRESTVVTKAFVVEKVAVDIPDEDERFLTELIRQEKETGSSDLSQRNKKVDTEREFLGNGVALELQDFSIEKRSLPSHPIGPQILKNYLNSTSDKEESCLTTWISPSQFQGFLSLPYCQQQPAACDHWGSSSKIRLCFKCHSVVPVTSPVCVVCEALLTPQLQTQPSAHLKYETFKQQSVVSSPTSSSSNLLRKKEQGTQTTGLFYPSINILDKKASKLLCQKKKHNMTNDHQPLLTISSPGKGYWRKQLDHVCAHLRSYAQNNLEFRTLIGDPQMGKLSYLLGRKDKGRGREKSKNKLPKIGGMAHGGREEEQKRERIGKCFLKMF
uniref:Uncharacterized protein n=1 Tax=Salvator merianae TaxID=96440 RepID=A0A8D0EFK4_SALMN